MKKYLVLLAAGLLVLAGKPALAQEKTIVVEEMVESTPAACSADCHADNCSHWRRFMDWLTYQPLERPGLKGCCHHEEGYRFPPLYTFFPCCPSATCAQYSTCEALPK